MNSGWFEAGDLGMGQKLPAASDTGRQRPQLETEHGDAAVEPLGDAAGVLVGIGADNDGVSLDREPPRLAVDGRRRQAGRLDRLFHPWSGRSPSGDDLSQRLPFGRFDPFANAKPRLSRRGREARLRVNPE